METGLTFRDAILIASIPGIITAIIGYFLSLKATSRNIPMQVKAELDKEKALLEERIRYEQNDRFWMLKFDFFKELNVFFADFPGGSPEKAMEAALRATDMAGRSIFLFNSIALRDALNEFSDNCIEWVPIYIEQEKAKTPPTKKTFLSDLMGTESGTALRIVASDLGVLQVDDTLIE